MSHFFLKFISALTLVFLLSSFVSVYDIVVFAEPVDKENLTYSIQGGTVSAIEADEFFNSLIIMLESEDDGTLTITLPRDFIDSKIGDVDDSFFVLVEGEEVIFEETTTSSDRTLVIHFAIGTTEIEIIGTQIDTFALIPEPPVRSQPIETVPPQESEVMMPQESQEEVTAPQETGGGCLIATAAFGTELAPQVQLLREVRDNVLDTKSGTAFMSGFNSIYYAFSPTVADWERNNPLFKEIIKTAITPMLSTFSVLNYVDIDTEHEILGYGIGIILLNVGMYFIIPAIVILKIRSKFS